MTAEGIHHECPYRVFISYSHNDKALAGRIAEILVKNRLKPMWDKNFQYGSGFHDQIKNFIAHSHVFLPLITPESNTRNWVHQEIGFAMALNIPVLPVAVGKVPGEMIREIHAIKIDDDLGPLENALSGETIANILKQRSGPSFAYYLCAYYPADRATMIAKYCSNVSSLGESGLFRQKGALSSLHIPAKIISNPVWKARYGEVVRDESHCRLQREVVKRGRVFA